MLKLDVAALSEQGGRPRNEDCWGQGLQGPHACWVLCDGAGGHVGGAMAARLAVDEALKSWEEQPEVSVDAIAHALARANKAVLAGQRSARALATMCTTAAMVTIDARSSEAAWGNVGDSRVYLFREGHELHRTRDHTRVQELLDAGLVSGDAAREHPHRNLLTYALGARDIEFHLGPANLAIRPGDAFVICSDGFWEYVREEDMEDALRATATARGTLDLLAPLIALRAPPGNDNFTALVVRVAGGAPAV